MRDPITIPVFLKPAQVLASQESIGSPATVRDQIVAAAGEVLAKITIDEIALFDCIDSLGPLLSTVTERLGETLSPESVSVELGISAAGKIGFLGTGVETECAARIQLSFAFKR